MLNEGAFYKELAAKNKYDEATSTCIKRTVEQLLQNETNVNRPGMLLGKIQSGKTRTFIGVTALSFDNGYDITIVLTKGTKALATQTFERLKREFREFLQEDEMQLFDIMNMPEQLSKWELEQKFILVVKKETNNLRRLHELFFEKYPTLKEKKVLIIDDEADYASIGFSKTKQEILDINVIAGQIDEFRKQVTASDFLQVTATPYSLYLQPEDIIMENRNRTFMPIRPSFTELVPTGKGYIGGDYYFTEKEEDSISNYLFEAIDEDELMIMKKIDRRRLKLADCLTSKRIESLRSAIINFVVGSTIRRLQQAFDGERQKKYSFIIHTEMGKAAHEWQEVLVTEIKSQFTFIMDSNLMLFDQLIQTAYNHFLKTIHLKENYLPTFLEVKNEVMVALKDDYLMITKVNSEKEVSTLLDESGQLKLRTPMNLFIGGQILDRGITINNLIGFYYGRNPRNFQQDTVLQHSRMFGYRSEDDLTVTRFYTTFRIYESMKRMHEFDAGLREAFEKGLNKNGVIFIQQDESNEIIPCSPNKLLLSKTITLKPYKRMLPVGFQTGYKTNISTFVKRMDDYLLKGESNREKPFLIKVEQAMKLMHLVKKTHDDTNGLTWDVDSFNACMQYVSSQVDNKYQGKICVIIRTNRNIGRIREDGRYEDSPVYMIGEESELKLARKYAKEVPVLIMTRQNGEAGERKWRGAEFWWPVFIAPATTKMTVYSSNN